MKPGSTLKSACLSWLAMVALCACGTVMVASPEQPNVTVVPLAFKDYQQIKKDLENALDAYRQGKVEVYPEVIEKTKRSITEALRPVARDGLSEEAVFEFLARRLRDRPAYPRAYSGEELAQLEIAAYSSFGSGGPPSSEDYSHDAVSQFLQPAVIYLALHEMLADWGEGAGAIDAELVRHVTYFVKYFALCDAARTNRALERGKQYLPHIQKVFAQYGLPPEVAFALPFVESRFTVEACSSAGAVGMFQFMEGTARDFGLQVVCNCANGSAEVDERLDWQKTAQAAARYLEHSRKVFASLLLALGAYHHGPEKVAEVLKATAQDGTLRCFRAMFQSPVLGPFSREYIPQCLAAAYLYRLLRQNDLPLLPAADVHWANTKTPGAIAGLAAGGADLVRFNPDLGRGECPYYYANTAGYALVKQSTGELLQLTYRTAPSGLAQEATDSRSRPPQQTMATAAEQVEKNRVIFQLSTLRRAAADNSPTCTILYTFQGGNSLAELARIFQLELPTILNHPANRRIKERYPRQPLPGTVIALPGLAPTTTVVASQQADRRENYRFITTENQSLQEVARHVSHVLELADAASSASVPPQVAITPELILYWNRDQLPRGISVNDPLPSNLPLFIVRGYRK